jgi:lipopolysaccharide biosynthesis regulator YciM
VTHLWAALAVAAAAAIMALLFGDRLRRRRDEAQAFLKGVRSVISGDPDAAIEALSDAARLGHPEAVETYLALGALFRKEGDLARAVRLHRNMLMGPNLPAVRRPEVERELAEDYRRSGMLAEAAEILERLGPDDRAALAGLRDVRVEQGDLAGAVVLQRALSRGGAAEAGVGGAPDLGAGAILAHLLAALSREALERAPGQPALARERAREAIGVHERSADAWLALAEAEGAAGEGGPALEAVGRALALDPRCALQAWPAVRGVADRDGAVRFLEGQLAARPDDAALHVVLARALDRAGRRPEAYAAIRRALDHDRSGEVTFALRELMRAERGTAAERNAGPEELAARYDLLVAALLRKGRAPRCGRCGADAPARTWRCRRCGSWDSFA